MRLSQLIEQLQEITPGASEVYISRLALLLAKEIEDLATLQDVEVLKQACRSVSLRMDSLHDQQAAITEELNELARCSPCEFNSGHVWTLVRGIKIQSQILDLYLD